MHSSTFYAILLPLTKATAQDNSKLRSTKDLVCNIHSVLK